jgi:hypothetical protein
MKGHSILDRDLGNRTVDWWLSLGLLSLDSTGPLVAALGFPVELLSTGRAWARKSLGGDKSRPRLEAASSATFLRTLRRAKALEPDLANAVLHLHRDMVAASVHGNLAWHWEMAFIDLAKRKRGRGALARILRELVAEVSVWSSATDELSASWRSEWDLDVCQKPGFFGGDSSLEPGTWILLAAKRHLINGAWMRLERSLDTNELADLQAAARLARPQLSGLLSPPLPGAAVDWP